MRRIFGAGAGLLALSLLVGLPQTASAQIKRQGGGYLMRVKLAKGEARTIGLTADIAGLGAAPASQGTAAAKPQTMKVSASFTQKVLDVSKGVATVEIANSPLMVNGQSMMQAQKHTAKINSLGKPLSGPLNQNMGMVFPEKPVKPGYSWSGQLPVGPMAGGGTVKSNVTFVGVRNLGGKQVAEFRIRLVPQPNQPKGSGTVYFLASDGWPLRGTLNLQMPGRKTPQGTQSPAMKATMILQRK